MPTATRETHDSRDRDDPGGRRQAGRGAGRVPRITPLVRAEDGCIEYGAAVDTPTPLAAQSPPRPDVVVVVEKWASVAALQAHGQAPHMAEYRQRVAGLVEGVVLEILEPAV